VRDAGAGTSGWERVSGRERVRNRAGTSRRRAPEACERARRRECVT
jgi:hypothetical protein